MQRHNFQHDGLNLSYLDTGGVDETLVALHSHWMEGQTFDSLAAALAPGWRVIALDQRGHGYSGHAATYMREDYLGDIDALLAHLGISRTVLLGNSLGGVNAYQFAARHPDRVRALIVEDIGTVIGDDTSFALSWSGVFKTCQDLDVAVVCVYTNCGLKGRPPPGCECNGDFTPTTRSVYRAGLLNRWRS